MWTAIGAAGGGLALVGAVIAFAYFYGSARAKKVNAEADLRALSEQAFRRRQALPTTDERKQAARARIRRARGK